MFFPYLHRTRHSRNHSFRYTHFFRIICLCYRRILLYNLQQFFYLRLFLIKRHFSAISAIIDATFNAISAIFSAIGVNYGVIGINLTSINIEGPKK